MAFNFEEWKPVIGYPYEVSNMGRIRRSHGATAGQIRKLSLSGKPPSSQYLSVTLSRCGVVTGFRVHALVAQAFLGACPSGYEIDHKNGDHFDNCVTNLEYVTHQENQRRAYHAGRFKHLVRRKLSDAEVENIRSLFLSGATRYDLAELFGIHPVYAAGVANGRLRK